MDARYTLLTPTHNRSAFLRRMLHYFTEIGVTAPILVADSSQADHAAVNRQICDSVKGKLDCRYTHHPLPFMEKCCLGLADVDTPYVTFCADDDFQFPRVVDDCVAFLDNHEDYTTAQGKVIHVSNRLQYSSNSYKWELLKSYDIDRETAAERLCTIADDRYSTFYAVHRTRDLLHAFEVTTKFTNYLAARIYTEAMLGALCVMAGKVKVVPGVQYIQEIHGANESCVLARVADRSQAKTLHQSYIDGLAQEFVRLGMSPEESESLVKRNLHLVITLEGNHRPKRSIREKIQRELHRATVKLVKRFHSTIRVQSENAKSDEPDVLPSGQAYELARQLLEKYPDGILETQEASSLRNSA